MRIAILLFNKAIKFSCQLNSTDFSLLDLSSARDPINTTCRRWREKYDIIQYNFLNFDSVFLRCTYSRNLIFLQVSHYGGSFVNIALIIREQSNNCHA